MTFVCVDLPISRVFFGSLFPICSQSVPSRWDEPLRWHKLFGHSFRFHRRILASPSRRRGLGKNPNSETVFDGHSCSIWAICMHLFLTNFCVCERACNLQSEMTQDIDADGLRDEIHIIFHAGPIIDSEGEEWFERLSDQRLRKEYSQDASRWPLPKRRPATP
jgi:hypothetical protein